VIEEAAADAEEVRLSADDAAELADLLRIWHGWLTGEDTDLLAASLERMPEGPDSVPALQVMLTRLAARLDPRRAVDF
jgi:hypothetical protein